MADNIYPFDNFLFLERINGNRGNSFDKTTKSGDTATIYEVGFLHFFWEDSLMKFVTGCVALCFVLLLTEFAEAGTFWIDINCTKAARDGGNGNLKDGMGDSLGQHNFAVPESGSRLQNQRENSIGFYIFDLPALAPGEMITGVQLDSTLAFETPGAGGAAPNFNLDAVALRIHPTNPHIGFSDYEDAVAALGTSQVIADDLVTPGLGSNVPLTDIVDGNLLSFLTGPSYVNGGKLFIAMVPDKLAVDNDLVGAYGVFATDGARRMRLHITTSTIPEPTTALLAVMSLGSLVAIRRRR